MPIAVKLGYTNPLTMMGKNKTGLTPGLHKQQENKESKDVKDLESKKQGVQNQILLMKNSTSSGLAGTEKLEQKLEEISTELKAAKSQAAQMTDTESLRKRFLAGRH